MIARYPEVQQRTVCGAAGLLMFIVLQAGVVFAAGLDLSQQQALLQEANGYFDQANALTGSDPAGAKDLYQKAILRWERIVGEGGVRNGKLYYNLGNAYFLSGDLGRAMLNYRRAERLIPNDPNLHQNASYVGNQLADRIDEPQRKRVLKTLFFWHYDLATKTRAILFALFFLILWGAAAARLFIKRPGLKWLIALGLVMSACLFSSLAVEAAGHARDKNGVILSSEVVGRKGNSETYQPSFQEPLHGGTEFALLEERGDWYYVELRDGRECWIPKNSAELAGHF